MIDDEFDFLPLRVLRVRKNGKRDFDPVGKRWLIEACLRPGASVSGLALQAGVNANQLRKWILLYRRAQGSGTGPSEERQVALPAFVPVVSMESRDMQQRDSLPKLTAKLPNGVILELDCTEQDAGIVRAVIEALGGR